MTQPAKASEPSMEEILASIRRIIADDDATKSAPPDEAPKPALEAVRPAPPPPAPPPSPPPRMVAPAPVRAPEPSAFEEPEAPAAESAPGTDDQSGDILELTESMTAAAPAPSAAPPAPQFRTIDADSDVGFDEAAEPPAPPPLQIKSARAEEPAKLLSAATSAAVDSAFNTLAQTVLVQNARTLEDLVREMLRPLLKSWLDDNLPGLVERLVRAEIERVSRAR
jgi:uncharacterized protein